MTKSETTAAQRLRGRRYVLGVTIGEVADKAGVSRQTIHRLETVAMVPNAPTAARIAQTLDCEVADIWRVEDLSGKRQ